MLDLIHRHPRDQHIVFYPEDHRYEVDGVPYTSVTTVIKRFFPAFDADAAIAKMGKKHKYYGLPPEEIKTRWEQEREAASASGTEMHRQIEVFLNTGELGDHPDFLVFHQCYTQSRQGQPYRTEWVIYDEETRIAGTIDYVYRRGDLFCMTDWKRSKKIQKDNYWARALAPVAHLPACNFSQYALQQNLYRLILKRNYGIQVGKMMLAQIHGGKLTGYPVPLMEKEAARLMEKHAQELQRAT